MVEAKVIRCISIGRVKFLYERGGGAKIHSET